MPRTSHHVSGTHSPKTNASWHARITKKMSFARNRFTPFPLEPDVLEGVSRVPVMTCSRPVVALAGG